MGTERTRKTNINELFGRICSIKHNNGTYDKTALEALIKRFCYDKGVMRRTVNNYIETLKGAELLKLE